VIFKYDNITIGITSLFNGDHFLSPSEKKYEHPNIYMKIIKYYFVFCTW